MAIQELSRIREIARRVFGYTRLRAAQEEAILSVLSGRDTLVVMPTGSGKSAIYQIPALLIDGPTVIVSPLIALQKDQAEFLRSQDTGGAAVINSMLSPGAAEKALSEAEDGGTEFLFLGPEQFSNPERMAAIQAARPSFLVVDEAHCISEWGHSFRPDYLHLGKVIEALGHPTVLALTATANEDVRAEIVARLGMRTPRILVHGFDRPNIWLGVETAASEEKKRAMLLERVVSSEKPGIVYTSTRKQAEQISDELNSVRIRAAVYHAGLAKRARNAMQEQFMEGEVEVIVATSAFGMGVDKADVRFVFHYGPPDSIDSYYQEIGRAGRDGLPSKAVLFYCSNDLTIYKFFKGAGQICAADVNAVLYALDDHGEMEEAALRKITRLSKTKLSRALSRLEDCGVVELAPEGRAKVNCARAEIAGAAEKAAQAQAELHDAELARIEKMGAYATSLGCRRAQLISYFGEEFPESCGNCDNCQGSGTARAQLIAEARDRVAEEAAA